MTNYAIVFKDVTFEDAHKHKQILDKIADAASKALQLYPRGNMGLTPDSVKALPEFKADKAAYNLAAQECRKYNQWFVKQFKKEYRNYRMKKRGY